MVAFWKSPARSGALLLALALGATALSACGTESGDGTASGSGSESASPSSETPSASATPSGPPATDPANGLPVCAEVWVDGRDLPKDYTACSEDGTVVKPEKKMCGFGIPMIIHDERFYAARGNRVNDVGDTATSEQFQSALAACQA